MRARFFLTGIALALSLLAFGQTRSAIQSQYDRYAKAYVENDVKTMLSILTTNYTLNTGAGKVLTLKDYKKQLDERRKKGKTNSAYVVKIESLRVNGPRAMVLTKEITTGKDGAKEVHRYRDAWRKARGTWKLESTTSLGHG